MELAIVIGIFLSVFLVVRRRKRRRVEYDRSLDKVWRRNELRSKTDATHHDDL